LVDWRLTVAALTPTIMGSFEENQMSSKLKIGLLVAGHVVAGLLPVLIEHDSADKPSPTFIGLFALAFAQAGLLGIWGALGTTRPSWRLLAAIATTGCLCALAITAEGVWHVGYLAVELSLDIALPAVVVFLTLNILRLSRYRLHFAQSSSSSLRSDQFTIRHLLLATAAVAVVFAIGREARTISHADLIETVRLEVTYVTITLIAIDFSIFWGTLAVNRPMPRLAIILPSAFVAGMIPTYFLEFTGSDWKDHVTWSCIMGFQAAIMAVSFLVIRSCGWRLLRGTNALAASESASEIHAGEG